MNLDGDQQGFIQNADQIINQYYTETRDWLRAGQRLLSEGMYREARSCFGDVIRKEAHEEGARAKKRRSLAHLYSAVAILAKIRPSYRRPEEIERAAAHIANAGAGAMTAVLAALIKDDYFDLDAMTVPTGLAGVASFADPRALSDAELALLARHMVPCQGPTWESLSAEARNRNVAIDGFVQAGKLPLAPRERRIAVAKYFYPVPAKPQQPNATPATVMAVGGVMALVAPFVGILNGAAWYVHAALLLVLLAAGVVLVFLAITSFRDYQQDVLLKRRYDYAKAHTADRPTDAQMDSWLEEDVRLVAALGARRHRVEPIAAGRPGHLIVEPQSAVGVSNLKRGDVERSSANGRSFRRRPHSENPLARVRTGSDGRLRSDHYRVLVIYLTDRRVAVYDCDLDFARRALLTESTRTFHYDDVVTISSRTVADSVAGDDPMRIWFDDGSGSYAAISLSDRFSLSLVSGESVEVGVGIAGPMHGESDLEVAWGNSQVKRVVQRMVWSRKERRSDAA
ncbi:hypothetical protein [Asanoa iriomotensis]|uniref:Uncharacterized protein n=1 Tax=Asanoa iriomotensis TaxID=234613 RepID=A0ABQ4C8A3_9ACTN|nr:hypothetical protein [Asanoa iriomotensis]GIF58995.1 hypothetical protein Air01nite_50900 [Asanoa iriomotensis]